MVLFTKDYLPTPVLCFRVLILRLWSSLLGNMVLEIYPPIAFQARLPVYALNRPHIRAINLRYTKVSQPHSFILLANLAALFCTRFKALTFFSVWVPTHRSVLSIGLEAKLSYFHFPSWVHALCNEVPSMLFVVCNWHDLPSLDRFV